MVWAVAAYRLQNLPQRKNLLLGNEQAHFAVGLGIVTVSARLMDERLTFDIEFKPKAGSAFLRPQIKGRLGNAFNNLRGLTHVEKSPAGLLVNVGRRLHPRILPRVFLKITKKTRKERSLMALPGLVTREAGAAVTTPVSASPDVNHEPGETNTAIFDDSYRDRHNREIWRGPYCNDATAYSYPEDEKTSDEETDSVPGVAA
jgi:hypothetical protein